MKHEIVTPEENGMSSRRLELIKPAMQNYVDRKKLAGLSTLKVPYTDRNMEVRISCGSI